MEQVERARRGDVDAFVALVAQRERRMVRTAMAILGDPADADDALQEALTAMWQHLPALRDARRFDVWADRILINACRLALRRRIRGRARLVPLDLDDPAHHGRTEAPDGPAAARDALDAAFEQLDADQRAILTLHHLQGRGLAEIAAVLEVPVGTVKSRLHTARRRLEHAIESTSR